MHKHVSLHSKGSHGLDQEWRFMEVNQSWFCTEWKRNSWPAEYLGENLRSCLEIDQMLPGSSKDPNDQKNKTTRP